MSQWVRPQGQNQGRVGNPNRSAAFNTFLSIQMNCQEHIRRLFESLALTNEEASLHGVPREVLIQRMSQQKNDCFARNICPREVGAAYECVVRSSPSQVARGDCDFSLQAASRCHTDFWARSLSPQVEQGMRRYAECAEVCKIALDKQKQCLEQVMMSGAGKKKEDALMQCSLERLQAQECLGKCLDPVSGQALDQCRKSQKQGDDACQEQLKQVLQARDAAGKATLLHMGLSEQDIQHESVDALMDMVGMVVFVGFVENQKQ